MLSRGGRFNRSLHNWTLMRLITMMNWAVDPGRACNDRVAAVDRRHQFFPLETFAKHCAISSRDSASRSRVQRIADLALEFQKFSRK